jgi:hypothetical protein
MRTKFLLENKSVRDHLKTLGRWEDIKMILWKQGGRVWTVFIWLRMGVVVV